MKIKIGFLFLLGFSLPPVFAASLQDGLKELDIPDTHLIPSADREKLYSVQTRYLPLSKKHEVGAGISKSFTAENFIVSYQAAGNYRYHFNDRWSVGGSTAYFFNQMSAAGDRLIKYEKIYPDIPFNRLFADATAGLNVFYGKVRASMEQVLHFDVYALAGPGIAWTNRGIEPSAVGDLGLAFWLGQRGSLRVGLKDSFHQEQYRKGKEWVHDLIGHLDIAMLFGGE